MAAAASSIAPRVLPQYDVFLSFRGPDTRHKFTSHLYAALQRNKIHAYIDDKSLERGDEIGPALLGAIKQSKLSIIIFSKHYASSSWCLDELMYILKCMDEYGQLVVPVFYEIDPSDVRWQMNTYADAFVELEKKFKDQMDRVQVWKNALIRAANLSGYDSQSPKLRHETELVDAIVDDVLMKLNRKVSYCAKGLVGMDYRIEQLELLLCISAQNVTFRAVCIWGMGGCGKTTLADVVFHRNSYEFQSCVFLANVREESEKHGLIHLRNELLRKLLEDQHISIDSPSIGSSFVIDRLSRTKVLVVFDDVSDLSQLDKLLGDQLRFAPGSRIIITTRNRRILGSMVHEDHVYKMDLLPYHEALQLFQSIAFKGVYSREGYSDLSEKVVNYAGCNPLALKVLGSSFFYCKSKRVWEEELEKLKTFPNKEVHDVLRWSYDGLEENEKRIFLHIACFLKGENRYDAERVLEMLELSPLSGIEILIDMSLISIDSVFKLIQMHDLLQEVGRVIEDGTGELGKRKRLWNNKDSYQVLHNESEASIVEAMYLDMSKIPELQSSPTAFRNMQKLMILKLYVSSKVHKEGKRLKTETVKGKISSSLSWFPLNRVVKAFQCFLAKSRILGSLRLLDSYYKFSNYDYEIFQRCSKLYFPKGLESLPRELRYLYWDEFPFKSLPSKDFPQNLVEIHMPYSQVKQLWSGNQNLRNLKHLNLSRSKQLGEIPDLSGSPKIVRIDLSGCTRLVEVPSYFQNLENLTYLKMSWCCNLKILGGIPCNIEELCLFGCGIEQITPSTWPCEKLHPLDLSPCFELQSLNTSKLNVCGDDQTSPSKSVSSESCKLKRRPSSSSAVGYLFSLRNLNLGWCRVSEIHDGLICSPTLEDIFLAGTMIESIPTSIKNASGLRSLDVSLCKKLRSIPELPSQLYKLNARECTSLKSVASSRSVLMRPYWTQFKPPSFYAEENCSFIGCMELDESSRNNIIEEAQLRIMRMASTKHVYSLEVDFPGNEIPRWFKCKSEGCEINIKFPHHTTATEEYPDYLHLALAVVVADTFFYVLTCDCNFKTNNGESHQRNISFGKVFTLQTNYEEDHVVLFSSRNISSLPIPFNKVTEASFRFYAKDSVKLTHERVLVKKCGVHLLQDDIVDTTWLL